ncbi:hypothetical protein OS493_018121 [Desmophyllum pertusum]|uniref:Uncharacterized protein n=1 Tax=Desmophyllum pertusum TaxID=174260 RepID=A0A9W9YPS3_9CNID|nr:hypothetical protein OS493_018121 [Desmophyllum pertusum]
MITPLTSGSTSAPGSPVVVSVASCGDVVAQRRLIMYSYSIFIPELKADTGVWTEYNEGLNQVENLHFGISGINALLIPSTACIKLKTAAWKSDFGDPSPEYSQPFIHLVVAI